MGKTEWWLLGDVKIPENKLDELNGYVIQLLDKCGIRKTEEITLAGYFTKNQMNQNMVRCL